MAKFQPPGFIPKRATVVYSGEGVPDVDDGNSFDWYHDRLTGDLYQKNEAGTAWEVIGSVSGGGGGSAALRGAGAPVSGPGGTEAAPGTRYYDDNFNPPVPYEQMGADEEDPQWVSLLTGDQT